MSDIFPRLDKNLQLSTSVEGPASVKAVEAFKNEVAAKFASIPIGKHLLTEVLAKLNDGSYLSNVDGLLVRLNLPENTQVGDKLHLSLLQLSPRPTFVLDGGHQVVQLETPHKFVQASLSNPLNSSIVDLSKGKNSSNRPLAEFNSSHSPETQLGEASDSLRFKIASDAKDSARATRSTEVSEHIDTVNISQQARLVPSSNAPKELNQTKSQLLDAYHINTNRLQQSAGFAGTSSDTELSAAGQLINALINETSQANERLSIENKQALIDRLRLPEASLKQISSLADHIEKQLHDKISHSGLFYESHVAQWAQGKISLDQLHTEPQAQLALAIEDSVLRDTSQSAHAPLAKLVHQQLDVIEQQKLQFSGMLTSTLPFQWQIEKETRSEERSDQDLQQNTEQASNQKWRSKLTINLPQLGSIAIDIQLSEAQLQVDLKGDQAASIALLNQRRAPLNDALQRVGPAHQALRIAIFDNT